MNPANEFPFSEAAAIIRDTLGEVGSVVGVPMPGGASTRRFARFQLGSKGTIVAIYVPDAHRSDELVGSNAAIAPRWPFLEIRDLLASRGIRVPTVLAEACDHGLLLVEDLGDLTLDLALQRYPTYRTSFYQQAVSDLAAAQRALCVLPERSVVATRSFDEALLRSEVDHFREWALGARSIVLSPAEQQVFDNAATYLATTIAAWPIHFVHRDYQSRNLMVRFDTNGQFDLTWIDFQDALLGPRVYDLVALLGDSYQTFDRVFVDSRLDEFAHHTALDTAGRVQLRREFDLVTVQRKLKDAGRFVFIDRVKHNPHFLRFVEPTIDKVLQALSRLRDLPPLSRLEDLLRTRVRTDSSPNERADERAGKLAN